MNGLGAVDAFFERAYRRHGDRVFLRFMIFVWVIAYLLTGTIGVLLGRIEQIPVRRLTWLVLGCGGGIFVAAAIGGIWASVRMFRRARTGDPSTTWQRLLRLPYEVTRFNCSIGMFFISPLAVVLLGWAVDLDTPLLVVFLVLTAPCGVVLMSSVISCLATLVLRPMVRDAALALVVLPVPPRQWSVRAKLAVGVATTCLAMTVIGAIAANAPGIDHATLLRRMLIAVVVALVVYVPVALLLAFSLSYPLGDLLTATQRLGAGDFGTRVPEVSADEYASLARSFNETVEGLARGQELAADNQRLLDEVRGSRARIVTASDAERRRVERNLHDGAQQRLVALSLDLRMIEEETADPALASRVHNAGRDLRAALDELRELARGLHPPVLATDGLRPALEQLACRAPVPVAISAPDERFDATIEATAYFVAGEALANVAKHAAAGRAEISVRRTGRQLVIEISDDGVGGAQPDGASGLAGLRDRVAALDGVLTVHSPPGAGTRIRAELPVDPGRDMPYAACPR